MPIKNLSLFNHTKVVDEENIIIGSGAGGSTVALELLKKGKKSVILEEGPDVTNYNVSNIGRSIVNLYKNNGATPIISTNGGPLIGYGQGSCVGGSTYVNGGYFSNTPEWVFHKWLDEKRTILNHKDFIKLLDEIKLEMKISTENLTSKDGDSKFLFDRAKEMNWSIEKCERFSTGLEGKEKQNMNTTYHKKLLENNVDIIHNCKVEKITAHNKTARSIEVLNKIDNKKYYFKFKNLFINCGPINTPYLLLKNKLVKFEKKEKQFEFHINFKIIVKFGKEINLNQSNKFDPNLPISIYFIREFEKDGALLSAANSELSYMLATCSHFNENIKKDLFQNTSNYAMYIYQIKSSSLGRINYFLDNPFVEYEYNIKDNEEIKKAINRTANFFFNGDAEFILYPFENSLPIKSIKEAKDLSNNFNPKKLHSVSVHGMSSMRSGVGEDYKTDYYGKLKTLENVYINDASVLPGNTGESPQASIMAFAKFMIKNSNIN